MLVDIVAIVIYVLLGLCSLTVFMTYCVPEVAWDDQGLRSISGIIEQFQPVTKLATGVFSNTIFLTMFLASVPYYGDHPELAVFAFLSLCGLIGISVFDTHEYWDLHILSLFTFWISLLTYANRFIIANDMVLPYVIFLDVTSGLGFLAFGFNLKCDGAHKTTQTLFELLWTASFLAFLFALTTLIPKVTLH